MHDKKYIPNKTESMRDKIAAVIIFSKFPKFIVAE